MTDPNEEHPDQGSDEEKDLDTRVGEALGKILVLPITLLLLVGAAYAAGDAIFTDTEVPPDPSVLDRILASDSVLAAVRIAVIFAAGYLVISVVALISRGQWLTRVGPVQVSEVQREVGELINENNALRNALESAGETIGDLEDELQASNQLFETLVDTMAHPKQPGGEGEESAK